MHRYHFISPSQKAILATAVHFQKLHTLVRWRGGEDRQEGKLEFGEFVGVAAKRSDLDALEDMRPAMLKLIAEPFNSARVEPTVEAAIAVERGFDLVNRGTRLLIGAAALTRGKPNEHFNVDQIPLVTGLDARLIQGLLPELIAAKKLVPADNSQPVTRASVTALGLGDVLDEHWSPAAPPSTSITHIGVQHTGISHGPIQGSVGNKNALSIDSAAHERLRGENERLRAENAALKEELGRRQTAEDIFGRLEERDGVVWLRDPKPGESRGPYCPNCRVNDRLSILETLKFPFNDFGKFKCPGCDSFVSP